MVSEMKVRPLNCIDSFLQTFQKIKRLKIRVRAKKEPSMKVSFKSQTHPQGVNLINMLCMLFWPIFWRQN